MKYLSLIPQSVAAKRKAKNPHRAESFLVLRVHFAEILQASSQQKNKEQKINPQRTRPDLAANVYILETATSFIESRQKVGATPQTWRSAIVSYYLHFTVRLQQVWSSRIYHRYDHMVAEFLTRLLLEEGFRSREEFSVMSLPSCYDGRILTLRPNYLCSTFINSRGLCP